MSINTLRFYIREILKEGKMQPLEKEKFVSSLKKNVMERAKNDSAVNKLFEKDLEYAKALGWGDDYTIEKYLEKMLIVLAEKNPADKTEENTIVRVRLKVLGEPDSISPPPGKRLNMFQIYEIFGNIMRARRGTQVPEFDPAAASLSEIMSDLTQKRGWFVLRDSFRNEYHEWVIMPNYTERVQNVPDKLYHVTPRKNLNRILKGGLGPRSVGRGKTSSTVRKYPGRIYVIGSESAIQRVIDGFGGWGESDYAVLEIDKNSLPKGTKFFIDNEYEERDMFWTYTPIPASAIKLKESPGVQPQPAREE